MADEWETRAGGTVRSDLRGRTLRGHAIVFNQLSELMQEPTSGVTFREIIAPSAVDRTIREGIDLRALVNHDTTRVLGRQGASPPTLRVDVDGTGLLVEIDPPLSEEGVVESIRRGDISGMSFGFKPHGKDGYTVDTSGRVPILTLRDAIIREVSVVTFPAYVATSLAVRALGMGSGRSVAELLKARAKGPR